MVSSLHRLDATSGCDVWLRSLCPQDGSGAGASDAGVFRGRNTELAPEGGETRRLRRQMSRNPGANLFGSRFLEGANRDKPVN